MPFDSMIVRAPRLSCAKNMVHARPVEFLNEGDVCEERAAVWRTLGKGPGTSARIPAPTWPCATQLGYRLLSEPVFFAAFPGPTTWELGVSSRASSSSLSDREGFRGRVAKLDFRPWNFGPMRVNETHTHAHTYTRGIGIRRRSVVNFYSFLVFSFFFLSFFLRVFKRTMLISGNIG